MYWIRAKMQLRICQQSRLFEQQLKPQQQQQYLNVAVNRESILNKNFKSIKMVTSDIHFMVLHFIYNKNIIIRNFSVYMEEFACLYNQNSALELYEHSKQQQTVYRCHIYSLTYQWCTYYFDYTIIKILHLNRSEQSIQYKSMELKRNYIQKFDFKMDQRQRLNSSSISRSYDVIFVGQLGAVVAHHFIKNLNFPCKCLVINNTQKIIEPSLSFANSEQVVIKKLCPQKCDIECKRIAHLRPIIRQIEMESGCIYYYRYLVYGQNNWADKDFMPRLKQALSNEFSLIYSNWEKTDLSKIYKYQSGNLVFYVPKQRHSGYQNYNFLKIYQKFINKGKKKEDFKCKIILQGTTFLLFNKRGDQFIKSKLRDNGVELIFNSKITKIDYLRRRLTLNENKQIQYTIFYCILHQKTPTILQNADIDPYDNNPKTLYNKKHKNIFVFGSDIFPTTHSFAAMNNQAHVIRHNLITFLHKKDNFAFYDGQSSIKFWINSKEAAQISHDYQEYNIITSNCLSNYFRLLNYKTWASWQVDIFYNLNSDGQPFYIVSPIFQDSKNSKNQHQEKNQVKLLRSNFAIEKFENKQNAKKVDAFE